MYIYWAEEKYELHVVKILFSFVITLEMDELL